MKSRFGLSRCLLPLASLVVLLGLFLGGVGCQAGKEVSTASSATPVKIMTYNIHGGRGGIEKEIPAEEGLERVAQLVEKYRPDLLLVQEIEQGAERSRMIDEVQWLKQRLNYAHSAFAPAFEKGEWKYGVALFSNIPGTISSTRHELFRGGEPGKWAEQRTALEATLEIDGVPVRVICTHLGLDSEERANQVADLMKILGQGKGPAIVAGDFNAEPGSPELKPLEDKLTDVLTALGIQRSKRLTFPQGDQATSAIDGIFVSSEFEPVRGEVIVDMSSASDHNPVMAEVRLRKP